MKEIWIKGLEGKYAAREDGEIISYCRGAPKVLKGVIIFNKTRGVFTYRIVSIGDKTYYIHRIVAEAFIDNPDEKSQVNHIDGDKNNNKVENLEWVTPSENISHAYSSGLMANSLVNSDDIKYRTLQVLYGDLPKNTFTYWRPNVDRLLVKEHKIPPELLECSIPSRIKNLRDYWLYVQELLKACKDRMKLEDMKVRFNLDISLLSRIRNKKAYLKEWKIYEKYVDNLK